VGNFCSHKGTIGVVLPTQGPRLHGQPFIVETKPRVVVACHSMSCGVVATSGLRIMGSYSRHIRDIASSAIPTAEQALPILLLKFANIKITSLGCGRGIPQQSGVQTQAIEYQRSMTILEYQPFRFSVFQLEAQTAVFIIEAHTALQ